LKLKKIMRCLIISVCVFAACSCSEPQDIHEETALIETTTEIKPEIVTYDIDILYKNSQSEMYGEVNKIIVGSDENPDIVYNIQGYTSRSDKIFYLFLPCRADTSNLVFTAIHTNGSISGPYKADFTNKSNSVRVTAFNDEYTIEVRQSGIPSIHLKINEEHGKFSAVNESPDQSVFAYGDFILEVTDELAAEKGWQTVYESMENDVSTPETMRIRGRGNWTWHQNKKPYQIKIENKLDLLGMGKAKTWILLANVMDASLLRNQLFYDLANDIGLTYSPKIQPVDLFIDGVYMGSYSLSTKPEVNENRVEIDEFADFLLEFDHYAHEEIYTLNTKRGFPVTLHNQENFESVRTITNIMNNIESLIFDQSSNKYAEYIDIESWAKYYWVQDLSRNNDTLIGSSYIYYVADDEKLYAGPIWDMDNTLGIWGGGRNLKREGWHSREFNWFTALIRHSDFAAEVDRLYQEGGVKELFEALPDRVRDYEKYITASAEMNYIIHNREHFVPLDTTNYPEEVEYLQEFLGDRINWYKTQYD